MYITDYVYNIPILVGIAGALEAIRTQVANGANEQQIDEGFALAFRVAVFMFRSMYMLTWRERE